MAAVALNAAAVEEAALAQVTTIAQSIADTASDRYQQTALRPGGSHAPEVEIRDGHPVVTTSWPFAHLDEWGGANVHSSPTGAMRSAAIEAGTFTPAEKP